MNLEHGSTITRAAVLALSCAFASACGGGGDTKPAASAAPDTAAKPADKPTEKPAEKSAAKAEAPIAADGKAPTPGEKTPVPTVAEWNAVTGEVTVRGSTALQCETKGLREWIRVSCRGNHPELGTPTNVNVENAKGAETFKFAAGGVSSLVFRFEQGVKIEATFSWDRGQKRFLSEWPPGAPMPTAYGQFL
jgi:hypothetical protein